jgi:hypothetical protein
MDGFKNWKTTLAGVAAMLTAAGHLAGAVSDGNFSTLGTDGSMILAGLGLLFAKDHNVTGGTTRQPSV